MGLLMLRTVQVCPQVQTCPVPEVRISLRSGACGVGEKRERERERERERDSVCVEREREREREREPCV